MSVLYSDFFSAESSASSIYAELCFGRFFKWNAAAFSPKVITQHFEFYQQMLHSSLLVLLSANESKSTKWRWRFYWATARLHHQSELVCSHIPTACWTSKHRWCLQMWNTQQYKLNMYFRNRPAAISLSCNQKPGLALDEWMVYIARSLTWWSRFSSCCRWENRKSETEQPEQQHGWNIRVHSQQLSWIPELQHQVGHHHL